MELVPAAAGAGGGAEAIDTSTCGCSWRGTAVAGVGFTAAFGAGGACLATELIHAFVVNVS